MLILLITFLISGILLSGLNIPLIRKQVPPNCWYGFRTPATLADPDIWYRANAYSAWRFLFAGLAVIITSVITYLIPDITLEAYAWTVTAVLLLSLTIALVSSFVYLKQITKEPSEADLESSHCS